MLRLRIGMLAFAVAVLGCGSSEQQAETPAEDAAEQVVASDEITAEQDEASEPADGEEVDPKRLESASNMKMMTFAVQNYEAVNDAWPDSLMDANRYSEMGDLASLLTNPVTGDNPGYEYVKPTGDKADDQILFYQLRNGERDLSLEVCYGDFRVELAKP